MSEAAKLKFSARASLIFSTVVSAIFFLGLSLIFSQGDLGLSLPIVLVLCALFLGFQYFVGPSLVEAGLRLIPISSGEFPMLQQAISELNQQTGTKVSQILVSDDPSPNAFVYGTSSSNVKLVVTRGLLEGMRYDELKSVLAHEFGHIHFNDYVYVTLLSAVPLLAYLVFRLSANVSRSLPNRYRGRSERSSGSFVAIGLALAAFSFVIYFIAMLAVRWLSRMREHYADVYSAEITRNPEGLIRGLVKITYGAALAPTSNESVRQFYIADPVTSRKEVEFIEQNRDRYDLNKDGLLDEYELEEAMEEEARTWASRGLEAFSTHPPTYKRILLLRQLSAEFSAQTPAPPTPP